MAKYFSIFVLITLLSDCYPQTAQVIKNEFIYETAPFPSCHASTIAETPSGLIVAFFGGTAEKNPDVGIWISRNIQKKWTEPLEVANGIMPDGKRLPTWNPVLFRYPDGPLILFYKVGPSPSEWWGMLIRSTDDGKSWSKPERLPDGFMGPVKNKPVLLKTGLLLCPSSTENDGWKVQMEMSSDIGKSWNKVPVRSGEKKFSAIQPSVLFHNNRLQILCRTKEGCIAESWSEDDGMTWSPFTASSLPNPNSGIDAVTLENGNQLLVYNPTTTSAAGRGGPRTPLTVSISNDGKTWKEVITLESEPGEYSYPAVIQTSDRLIHITYTWKRKLIKHVVLKINNSI